MSSEKKWELLLDSPDLKEGTPLNNQKNQSIYYKNNTQT